jgi:DNA-binding Lrp family transcriptional regulator
VKIGEVEMDSQKIAKPKEVKFNPKEHKLDDQDKLILTCIKDNPKATIKEIGEILATAETKIHYPTLQKRIHRLMEIGAAKKHLSVDLLALGYEFHFRIDIKINSSEIRERKKGRTQKEQPDFETRVLGTQKQLAMHVINDLVEEPRFKDHILVGDVHILLGTDVDLSIDLYVKDHNKMTEFITEGLRNLLGVADTKTGWLSWSAKQNGR